MQTALKRSCVLLLSVVSITVSGCGDPQKDRPSQETSYIGINHPLHESWNLRLTVTKSGLRRAVVEAGYGAEFRTKAGTEHHLENGLKVTFFDVNGLTTNTLTARKAVIHDNRDIEILGNVIMTSKDNTVVKTEYAIWTVKDKMIRSNRLVTITRPNQTISGKGFESDQELKKYRIFQVSGEAVINK